MPAPVLGALAAVWITARAPAAGLAPPDPSHGHAITASPSAAPTAVTLPPRSTDPSSDRNDERPPAELGAVIETSAARALPANSPMSEEDSARQLAHAWHAVVGSAGSELTLCLLWAHWAHETGRGQRMHAYNFAGLKGRGPSGASVVVWTREGPSSSELVQRTFRAYRTPAEGARDYVHLLKKRYPAALRAAKAGNPLDFSVALETGGYFTGDSRAYLRALGSLSIECRRRELVVTALHGTKPD